MWKWQWNQNHQKAFSPKKILQLTLTSEGSSEPSNETQTNQFFIISWMLQSWNLMTIRLMQSLILASSIIYRTGRTAFRSWVGYWSREMNFIGGLVYWKLLRIVRRVLENGFRSPIREHVYFWSIQGFHDSVWFRDHHTKEKEFSRHNQVLFVVCNQQQTALILRSGYWILFMKILLGL